MAYPTTADLVDASSCDALIELGLEQQDGLRAAAIVAVEQFTGQVFDDSDSTEIVDGTGARDLWLPKRLEMLDSLLVHGSSIDATDVALSAAGDRLYVNPAAVPGTWATRAIRGDDPPVFRRGIATVEITGTWGWTDCPAAVVTALRFDMEDAAEANANRLAPSMRSWDKLGVDSISQGNLSLTMTGRKVTLSNRAADLLDPDFVWQGIGKMV
jgi:hypothetical protein